MDGWRLGIAPADSKQPPFHLLAPPQLAYLNFVLRRCFPYYNLRIAKGINFAGDFQFVNGAAYNADRAPVYVTSLRLHFEY